MSAPLTTTLLWAGSGPLWGWRLYQGLDGAVWGMYVGHNARWLGQHGRGRRVEMPDLPRKVSDKLDAILLLRS